MKIKFVKPLPRIDHVILPGQILDAPEGFAKKMVQTGRAVWAKEEPKPVVDAVVEPVAEPVKVEAAKEEPAPEKEPEVIEEAPKPKARARKKRDAE